MSTALRIDRLEKNYVINGGMHFFQRQSTATITLTSAASATQRVADRFVTYANRVTNNQSYTTAQSTDVPTEAGFVYPFSTKVSSNFAHSFTGEDRTVPLIQYIEGQNLSEIGNSDTIFIRFWWKASTAGTYGLDMAVSSNGTSLAQSYVQNFTYTTAGVWQLIQLQVTLPGVALHRGTGLGLAFAIASLAGSTSAFQASSLNTWLAGDFSVSPSTVNWASSTSGYVQMTGLAITKSAVASYPLAGKDISGELRLAQRYYEVIVFSTNHLLGTFDVNSFFTQAIQLVQKRATPTATCGAALGSNTANGYWTAPGQIGYGALTTYTFSPNGGSPNAVAFTANYIAGGATPTTSNAYHFESGMTITADADF